MAKQLYILSWEGVPGSYPTFIKLAFSLRADSEEEARKLIKERLFKDAYERHADHANIDLQWDETLHVRLDMSEEFFDKLIKVEQVQPRDYVKTFLSTPLVAHATEAKSEDDTLDKLKSLQERDKNAPQPSEAP